MKRCIAVLLVGCVAKEPVVASQPAAPLPTPAARVAAEPAPAVAAVPFDWTLAVADGESHRSSAVAERVKRFPKKVTEATPEVVVQASPRIVARAVYRETTDECSNDGEATWSLEVTIANERWQVPDFAQWYTDCAAISDGFERGSIRLEARDLLPGDPLELVLTAEESHAWFEDDCDCSTHTGRSDHVWACGIAASGVPVCWAHVETSREIGPGQDPQDCACAAGIAVESWALDAELVAPGMLRVGDESRELAKLPCTLDDPPPAFGC